MRRERLVLGAWNRKLSALERERGGDANNGRFDVHVLPPERQHLAEPRAGRRREEYGPLQRCSLRRVNESPDSLRVGDEDQIVTGSGTGENFLGILNDPAVPTPMFDVLRQAIARVRVDGRTAPTAIAMHPNDARDLDLLKVNAEVNHFVSPPGQQGLRTLWGTTVVESEALPVGTALVGDFRRAVLFDREAVTISVGTVGDDFTRNIVRILAEARAGFGVVRPTAFCEVDLAA